MSLAVADERALQSALNALNKYGGSAIWTDIITPAVTDDFGNVITPEVSESFDISILPTKIEDGWINSNIANADSKVFLVASKELSDLGVEYNGSETITYNGTTYSIERDEGYSGGNSIILHRFICSVTT